MGIINWKLVKSAADNGRRWRKPRAQSIEDLVDRVARVDVDDIDEADDIIEGGEDTMEEGVSEDIPEPVAPADELDDEAEGVDESEVDHAGEDGEESWIDKLTPTPIPESIPDEVPQTGAIATPEIAEPADSTEEEINAAEELRQIKEREALKERLSNLKTVDAEVAEELLESIVNPVVEAINARHRQETEALRKQLDQVRNYSDSVANNLTAKERAALMSATNAKIQQVFPKAYDILNSTQFTEFLDATSSPYATEKKSDILKRAYTSGDADYVIETINNFKQSIQKPKPAVSADAKGASGTTKSSSGGKRMTEAQFHAKRAKLRAAPQTPETRRALRVLSETYTKQLKGK